MTRYLSRARWPAGLVAGVLMFGASAAYARGPYLVLDDVGNRALGVVVEGSSGTNPEIAFFPPDTGTIGTNAPASNPTTPPTGTNTPSNPTGTTSTTNNNACTFGVGQISVTACVDVSATAAGLGASVGATANVVANITQNGINANAIAEVVAGVSGTSATGVGAAVGATVGANVGSLGVGATVNTAAALLGNQSAGGNTTTGNATATVTSGSSTTVSAILSWAASLFP